jgi:hypothetical protein
MTAAEYRDLIAKLGLSQVRAGKLFGLSPRQAQRLALGEAKIPKSVEIITRCMIRFKLTPDDVEKMLGKKRTAKNT